MSPTEWAWLYATKTAPRMYGRMTEAEVAEIYAETYGPGGDDE